MKIKELVHKKLVREVSLDWCCDMGGCNRPVETILVFEDDEWQLCSVCFGVYMEEEAALLKRDAAEHLVERTEPGLTVTEYATSEGVPVWLCKCSDMLHPFSEDKCLFCDTKRPVSI
jgi:hypothetical protein